MLARFSSSEATASGTARPACSIWRAADKIDEVIDLFHLDEFVDDLTERYSHGMRQRTVFAAALVHEPKLLIADEPTVGLDPKSIRELKTLLRRLATNGMTVFLSTHTLDIAQELADRIGIIDRGRLLGCGTLKDLQKQASSDGNLEDLFLKITEEAAEEGEPVATGGVAG